MKVIVADNETIAREAARSYHLERNQYVAVTPFNYHCILNGIKVHPANVYWHQSAASFSPDMIKLINGHLDTEI